MIATHDPFCRPLSEAAGVIVASVEYRLAPEHPYPAALEDTIGQAVWFHSQLAGRRAAPCRPGCGGIVREDFCHFLQHDLAEGAYEASNVEPSNPDERKAS